MKKLVLLFMVLLLRTAVYATDYYVSDSSGDNNNVGTQASPFKTIQKAADIAVAGDNIYIMAGVYREEVVPANSGTDGAPITFQAYNNEEVIITGNDIITGWTNHDGDIYKANVSDKVWQVFADGSKQDIARYPNFDGDYFSYSDWAQADSDDFGVGSFDSETFSADHWVGATVRLHAGVKWVVQSGIVTASSGSSFTVAEPSAPWNGSYGAKYLGSNSLIAMYNHINALDAAKEWYWEAGTLYFHMGGKDVSTVTMEARTRYWAFNATEKSYIHLKGINVVAGSVTFEDSNYCVLENTNVLYPAPFMFDAYASGWSRNTRKENWAGKPVYVSGSNNIVKDCYIANSWTDGIAIQGANNRVENCLIENTDWSGTDAGSISASGEYHYITRNTARNTGRSIIVHRDAPGINITYNNLYDCGKNTDDLGLTYTYNSNGLTASNEKGEIAYNWAHHNNAEGTPSGIYLDNTTSNYSVHHNVVYNVGYAIHTNKPADNHDIFNNTVFKCANAMASSGSGSVTNQTVRNNLSDKIFYVNTTSSNNLITSSPGFTDVDANDYTLQANSPAIDYGMELTGITDGYTGSAPDVGAYEYGVTPWIPGSDVVSRNLTYVTVPTECKVVGDYLFIENANDSSIYGNNGVVNGATLTTNRNDYANSAYSFDGVDDSIEVTEMEGMNAATDFTISGWIYPNNNQAKQWIIGNRFDASGAEAGGLEVSISNGNINFLSQSGSSISAPITAEQWSMFTLVRENGIHKIYINGVFVEEAASTAPSNNSYWIIGSDPLNTDPLDGKIDSFKLQTCVFTDQEILDSYVLNVLNVSSIDDAHVRNGDSEYTNYGTINSMPCKNSGFGYAREVFLKFDLTGFDPQIAGDYKLKIYSTESVSLNVYEVANNWSEDYVTWSTQPEEENILGTIAPAGAAGFVELDITNAVISAMASDDLLSVKISANDSEAYTEIKSKEHPSEIYHPEIYKTESDLSIGEEEIQVFAMYPNPASESFTISFTNSNTDYNQLSVFDVTGRLIYTQKVERGTKDIEVPVINFAEGMHIVKLSGVSKTIFKKLIVN